MPYLADKNYPKEIEEYLDQLLAISGANIIPPSVRETMKKDIYLRLEAKIMLEAIKSLDVQDRQKLQTLFATNPSPVEIVSFLSTEVKNPALVWDKSLEEFAKSYLLV